MLYGRGGTEDVAAFFGSTDCRFTLIKSVGLATIAPSAPARRAEENFIVGEGRDCGCPSTVEPCKKCKMGS